MGGKKYFVLLFLWLFIAACSTQTNSKKDIIETSLKAGMWRGILTTQSQKLPFNFEVSTGKGNVSGDIDQCKRTSAHQ